MSSISRKAKAAEMQAQLAQLSAVPIEAAPVPPLPITPARTRELASIPSNGPAPEPPAPLPSPAQAPRGRQWRTQGVTVYPADDERVERLAEFFKRRRIKFGKRGNLSLLIGAGLAELDRLAATNPDALIAVVRATMTERESA
jgi:hypothetical protein